MKLFARIGLIRDITALDIEMGTAQIIVCGGEIPCGETFNEWMAFRRLL